MNHKVTMNRITGITNVQIFDGERVLNDTTVVINGARIQTVGGVVPVGATVIDGHGSTLMPGLIDSHVHTDMDGLHDALKFGVTTELEMMGRWSWVETVPVAKMAVLVEKWLNGRLKVSEKPVKKNVLIVNKERTCIPFAGSLCLQL